MPLFMLGVAVVCAECTLRLILRGCGCVCERGKSILSLGSTAGSSLSMCSRLCLFCWSRVSGLFVQYYVWCVEEVDRLIRCFSLAAGVSAHRCSM